MLADSAMDRSPKKHIAMVLSALALAMLVSSCSTGGRYNTQKGALAGAGVGAVAGQIIGGNTGATLIGAGSGALIGAIVGNAQDQANQEAIDNAQDARHSESRQVAYSEDSPPGRWVMVPGQWHGHHWVPEHRQWVPVTP